MADNKSAAERVFATFELAETIIKDLSATQLLQFQRENRTVRKTIWSSPVTREALFLDAHPFSARNRKEGDREASIRNPIPGLPLTSPDLRIFFSNKTQARAVLVKGRDRYSWEDMFSAAPSDVAWIHLKYLAEENVSVASGAEELSWMTQRSVTIRAEALTLGAALKIAAKVVVDDIHAWDADTPDDNSDRKLVLSPAKAYLKFFQFEVDVDAKMDFNSVDLKKKWTYHSNPRATVSPLLLLRTWPWTKDTAKSASMLELEWLSRSDPQRRSDPRWPVYYDLVEHPTLGPPLYKMPDWARKFQPPSETLTPEDRYRKRLEKYAAKLATERRWGRR